MHVHVHDVAAVTEIYNAIATTTSVPTNIKKKEMKSYLWELKHQDFQRSVDK